MRQRNVPPAPCPRCSAPAVTAGAAAPSRRVRPRSADRTRCSAPTASAKARGVGVLFDLERIEAGADEEQELIAQHVAGGAQLAAKAVALAQLPGLAVSAAVAEGRKRQRDQRQPVEPRRELGNPAVVGPQHAGRRLAAREPAASARNRAAGTMTATSSPTGASSAMRNIRVVDDPTALNERHRRAP